MASTTFAWIEITGKCQLNCKHCYADSGPTRNHGSMVRSDWLRVIREASSAGIRNVQFIGGEPTLHPNFLEFVELAANLKLGVEVFSNLVKIDEEMWSVFSRLNVSLATSFYSDDPSEHERITNRPNSHSRTMFSIQEAVKRSIPVRVGVIEALADQRTTNAIATLRTIGVKEIGLDRTRKIGRGGDLASQSTDELCGKCGLDRIAISSNGDVWPCVFSRWMPVGNVKECGLQHILEGQELTKVREMLASAFSPRSIEAGSNCYPDCGPACQPNCPPSCSPSCSPAHNCTPSGNCWPNYK